MTVKHITKGNWINLLPMLGVDRRYLVNKHGPCPMCGGKDRFRWDNRNDTGTFYCSQCGAGDGFDLARRVTGKSFKDIAESIEKYLGHPSSYEKKPLDLEEMRQFQAMKDVWKATKPFSDDSPAGLYLIRRVGCLWHSTFVREHAGLWWEGKNRFAMVSKIVTPDDKAVNLHLTYLTRDGNKDNCETAKRVMSGKLPDGSAIRLGPAKTVMGIAEGIETAMSASLMYDIPVWAAINGTLLSKWVPPCVAEQITIFGDNDSNFTGQSKAFQLANRLEVQFKRRVTVLFPPTPDVDWNDVHQEKISDTRLRVIK
jgi:putative DNA primase/helicase